MTIVTVKDDLNTLRLDARQTDMFERELKRVTGFFSFSWLRALLMLFAPRTSPYPRVQPDCRIEVDRNGRVTEYLLLGTFVLQKKGSRISHQFYFGKLLLEWLNP